MQKHPGLLPGLPMSHMTGNNEIKVTASFGFTRFSGETEDEFNECFRLADEALYFAKENGRNKVVKKEY